LNLAAKKGIATVSGVEMFVAQGVGPVGNLDGKARAEAPMSRAVLAALRAEEKSSPAPLLQKCHNNRF